MKNETDVSLLTGKVRSVSTLDEHDKETLQLSKISNTVATIASGNHHLNDYVFKNPT